MTPDERKSINNRLYNELLFWINWILVGTFAFLVFYSFKLTQNMGYSLTCLIGFFIVAIVFIRNCNN
jgi:hypothetical protein